MKIFNTFFIGGYECADHINRSGERINLLQETQHDIRVTEDYEALCALGIKTVREGICWSNVEKSAGIFDFSEVYNRMKAAESFGIQQIWDLIHFGYPDGLYPTHPHFCDRFTALCQAFATFYKENAKQDLYVVPINEISFLSWHSGDVRGTVPFAVNSGWDIKYHLCKAAILGIKTLKEVDPDCVIVLVEPLVKIHCDENTSLEHANELNSHQFQAMDIIAGRMCPELGGSEDFLDILGFNYYWNCQWRANGETLDWPETEPLRMPVSDLLQIAYERYRKPIFLSETGHFGSGRVPWIEEITSECLIARENGVDFNGICIYPITDRPDWDDLTSYSNCGIWDLDALGNRVPTQEYIDAVIEAQTQFRNPGKIMDFFLNLFK
jgi:beta-glucosidase/6-phospho-beta-glucosidase/beta-galactosidase